MTAKKGRPLCESQARINFWVKCNLRKSSPLTYPISSIYWLFEMPLIPYHSLSQVWQYGNVLYGRPGLCDLTNLRHFHGCVHTAHAQCSTAIFTLRNQTLWVRPQQIMTQ